MKKVALIALLALILLLSTATPVLAASSVTFGLSPESTKVRSGDAVSMTLSIQSTVSVAVIDLLIEYDEAVLDCVMYSGIAPFVSDSEIFTDEKRGDNCLHLIYLDSEGGNSGIKNCDFFYVKFIINKGYEGKTATINVKVITAGDASANNLSTSGTSAQIQIIAGSAGPNSNENTLPQPSETKPHESTRLTVADTIPSASSTPSAQTTETHTIESSSTTVFSTGEQTSMSASQMTISAEPSPAGSGNTSAQPGIWVPIVAVIAAANAGIIALILKRRRLRQ
jgi:hypothetical protein